MMALEAHKLCTNYRTNYRTNMHQDTAQTAPPYVVGGAVCVRKESLCMVA